MSKKFNIKQEEKTPDVKKQQEVDVLKQRLKGKSLMIATPMYGGKCEGLFTDAISSLMILSQKIGLNVKTKYLFNESLINRARNYLMQSFLDSDCTHIMWIDADIAFNPYDVLSLLAYCDEKDPVTKKEMHIVGGLYPKKTLAADKMVAAVKAGLCDENPESILKYAGDLVFNPIGSGSFKIDKPILVSEVGTGFMLMSKESVNKIRRKNPQLKYKPDHVRTEGFDGSRQIYNLFDVRVDEESNRLLSEDYSFLKYAKDVGLNVFAFPWIKLFHVGTYIFQGNLMDISVLQNEIKEEYLVNPSGPLIKK